MNKTISIILIALCSFVVISSNAQIPVKGLICFLPCDNNANDESGNKNNGTIVGGVTKASDRWGNACGALSFNGIDGFIKIANSNSIKDIRNEFTVTAWFKISLTADKVKWLTLLCKGEDPIETEDNPQFRVQFQTSSKSTISLNTATAKTPYYGKDLPDNEWAFISFIYDKKKIDLFLNDSLIFSFPYNQSLTQNNSPLEIGRDVPGNTEFFKGSLDDIRIYNRALSQLEIRNIYRDKSNNTPLDDYTLNALSNINTVSDKGKCGRNVTYKTPSIIENCSTAKLTQIIGPSSGSFFLVGDTTIGFLAIGDNGRREVASFKILVKDEEAPVVSCIKDIYISLNENEIERKVIYDEPTAIDNCKEVTLERLSGLPSGSLFQVGTSEVKYKAVDNSGNKAECSFKITLSPFKKIENTSKETPPSTLKPNTILDTIKKDVELQKITAFGDSIRIRYNEKVNDCLVTLFVMDNGIEDGDTVSIIFNGSEVVKRERIRINKGNSYENIIALNLHLESGKTNSIIAKAWNVGSISPNTMEIRIFTGNVLNALNTLNKTKPILKKTFECYPGLTDGMFLTCQ